MRGFKVALLLLLLLLPSLASAQDSGETTREVVGWTADGKIAVRAVRQGERVVDGTAESYWFELDEVWDARLETPISVHRRGEPTGPEHPRWKKAKAEPVKIEPWAEGPVSPGEKHYLVTVLKEDRMAGDQGWVCTTTARTILLSDEAKAAFNVGETSATGQPATRSSQAECPDVRTEAGWSPDGNMFVVERFVDGTFGLVSGSVDSTGKFAESPMERGGRVDPLGSLPVGPLRTAWEALLRAEWEEAKSALATEGLEETGWTKLARAWLAGRTGDEKGAKTLARKAERDVRKDPVGLAMLGGAYALAGDNRRVKKTLDRALKTAEGWETYLQMATLLEDVDLSLYNQILVYGLSSEEGQANAEPWAWRLLIDGLVDAGLAAKGAALLERIPDESPAKAGARARLAIGSGDGEAARPDAVAMLWADIGNCDAYLLAGRAELLSGRPADALPLLGATHFCDPRAAEAAYFLSELHRAAGRAEPALATARAFLDAAPPRRSDEVRAARRARAQKTVERLGHPGVALVSLACRPLGAAFLCQGVLRNAAETPAEGVAAVISRGETELGRADVETIPAGESRSFGIRVETLDDALLNAGASEEDRAINRIENLRAGW